MRKLIFVAVLALALGIPSAAVAQTGASSVTPTATNSDNSRRTNIDRSRTLNLKSPRRLPATGVDAVAIASTGLFCLGWGLVLIWINRRMQAESDDGQGR